MSEILLWCSRSPARRWWPCVRGEMKPCGWQLAALWLRYWVYLGLDCCGANYVVLKRVKVRYVRVKSAMHSRWKARTRDIGTGILRPIAYSCRQKWRCSKDTVQ